LCSTEDSPAHSTFRPGIDDYRNGLLWSPEQPNLIDAEIQLWYKDRLIDEVKSYTAMRTVGIQRDRFMLNGRPTICGWF